MIKILVVWCFAANALGDTDRFVKTNYSLKCL